MHNTDGSFVTGERLMEWDGVDGDGDRVAEGSVSVMHSFHLSCGFLQGVCCFSYVSTLSNGAGLFVYCFFSAMGMIGNGNYNG